MGMRQSMKIHTVLTQLHDGSNPGRKRGAFRP
jgi:hypothetical protein